MVVVERCWPGYGCVIVGLVSIGKWISSARLGAAAGAGEHSGSAIYIQTMYTSHHTPDCSNIQHCTLPSSIQLQLHTDGVWFDEVWLDSSDRLSMKIFANKHPNCRKRKLFDCLFWTSRQFLQGDGPFWTTSNIANILVWHKTTNLIKIINVSISRGRGRVVSGER